MTVSRTTTEPNDELTPYEEGVYDGIDQALTVLLPLLSAAEEAARSLNKPAWLMEAINDAGEFYEGLK